MMNIRTAMALSSPQVNSSGAGSVAQTPNAGGALYPADVLAKASDAISAQQRLQAPPTVGLSSAEKTNLVNQLDAADKLAGLSFLCLREGDLQAAQQYMQQATDIRKSVEPQLTQSQQQSLENIMSLQQDAYNNIENANGNWITGIFGQFKAALDLSQASQDSTSLRNSILSEGQVEALQ